VGTVIFARFVSSNFSPSIEGLVNVNKLLKTFNLLGILSLEAKELRVAKYFYCSVTAD